LICACYSWRCLFIVSLHLHLHRCLCFLLFFLLSSSSSPSPISLSHMPISMLSSLSYTLISASDTQAPFQCSLTPLARLLARCYSAYDSVTFVFTLFSALSLSCSMKISRSAITQSIPGVTALHNNNLSAHAPLMASFNPLKYVGEAIYTIHAWVSFQRRGDLIFEDQLFVAIGIRFPKSFCQQTPTPNVL
jgi:hypothetical protein